MQNTRDEIYRCIDENYMAAVSVQRAWANAIAKREVGRKYTSRRNTESTNYHFKIEFNGSSFKLRWFNVKFVWRNGKKIRISKHIVLPKSGRYSISQFKYADDWELEIIEKVEENLCGVRNQVKHLMKAHQSLVWAAKCNGGVFHNAFETIPMKDRVEPTPYSVQEFKLRMS